jgi:multisubunit Na+/H+ antiporter MnhB subunit
MSAFKWFLVAVFAIGVVLFLYGANYYDPVVGWVGVAVAAAGLVGFLLLYIYDELAKRRQSQKS